MATPDDVTPDAEVQENFSSAPDAAPVADVPAAESDPFDSGADSFDRTYVEKLRKESAQYRTRAKEYEDYAKVFEPYTDEDRAVWQEAMRRFNEDPRGGAEYLESIAKAVLAEYQEEQADSDDEADRPLTVAQYEALREQERQKAAQEAEIARIQGEAEKLGYDPASDEYTYLLTVASRLPSGSLQEAHEKIEAAYEARVQARIEQMQAEAAGSPTAPRPSSGAAPSGERQLRTWADADAAFRARMEAAKARQ